MASYFQLTLQGPSRRPQFHELKKRNLFVTGEYLEYLLLVNIYIHIQVWNILGQKKGASVIVRPTLRVCLEGFGIAGKATCGPSPTAWQVDNASR